MIEDRGHERDSGDRAQPARQERDADSAERARREYERHEKGEGGALRDAKAYAWDGAARDFVEIGFEAESA